MVINEHVVQCDAVPHCCGCKEDVQHVVTHHSEMTVQSNLRCI